MVVVCDTGIIAVALKQVGTEAWAWYMLKIVRLAHALSTWSGMPSGPVAVDERTFVSDLLTSSEHSESHWSRHARGGICLLSIPCLVHSGLS